MYNAMLHWTTYIEGCLLLTISKIMFACLSAIDNLKKKREENMSKLFTLLIVLHLRPERKDLLLFLI